jgi:hypothetical protein
VADVAAKGHDIAAGIIYEDANIKVTAVENTHFRFQPGTPALRKVQIVLLPLRHIGPFVCVHW